MTRPRMRGGDGGRSPAQVLKDVANANLLVYFLTISRRHNYLAEGPLFLTFYC